MAVVKRLTGIVTLRSVANSVSDAGLAVPKLRVELVEEDNPDDAWIAELKVFGDLPWFKGESRHVEVRIMSEEFLVHVINKSPVLLVKRGNEVVGDLLLET